MNFLKCAGLTLLLISANAKAETYKFKIKDIEVLPTELDEWVRPSQLIPKTGGYFLIRDKNQKAEFHIYSPAADDFIKIFDDNRQDDAYVELDIHANILQGVSKTSKSSATATCD